MNAGHDPIAPFRCRLLGLAYRMLGRISDAEDVLQDAYLRLHGARPEAGDIANLEAFLVTIVTRLCLDRLKSARARRESYVGPWLPEPVLDIEPLSPHTALELADDLSMAMLLVLERLSPQERAAFLLHDIFDVGFAQIALVLGKSETACRQLASRARKAVRAGRPQGAVPVARQGALLAAFGAAMASGDAAALTALLREDAVLLSDGGGIKPAALNPILGADRIARYLFGAMRKFARRELVLRSEARMVNGALGIVSHRGGEVEQVMSLLLDGDRIAAVYVVRNPQKLAHLAATS
jgi:RNA polymerase sigma-70 factor, ECF subfamily